MRSGTIPTDANATLTRITHHLVSGPSIIVASFRGEGGRMRVANRLALIAAGYGLAIGGGIAAVAVNEFLIEDAIQQSSGGMVAFGDMIVFVLASGFLGLAPSWFLLKLCVEVIPRSLIAAELLFAAIGPASWLAVARMATSAGPQPTIARRHPTDGVRPRRVGDRGCDLRPDPRAPRPRAAGRSDADGCDPARPFRAAFGGRKPSLGAERSSDHAVTTIGPAGPGRNPRSRAPQGECNEAGTSRRRQRLRKAGSTAERVVYAGRNPGLECPRLQTRKRRA
jgi:hypothetical protein